MGEYADNLARTEQRAFAELFELTTAGEYERYTSYPESITFQNETWQRAPIRRSPFTIDSKFGKVQVQLTAPVTDRLQRYVANQPIEPTSVRIIRVPLSDLEDYQVLFSGQIIYVSLKERKAQATCESRSHLLTQRLPRIIYQSVCNWDVFDSDCGLDENIWKVSATLDTVTSALLVSTTFGGYSDGYFTGGRIIYENDMRLITNHTGNNCYIQIPFDSRVQAGISVYAYPGCDGDPSTCINKFNNKDNMCAMATIPSHNPSSWGFK